MARVLTLLVGIEQLAKLLRVNRAFSFNVYLLELSGDFFDWNLLFDSSAQSVCNVVKSYLALFINVEVVEQVLLLVRQFRIVTVRLLWDRFESWWR